MERIKFYFPEWRNCGFNTKNSCGHFYLMKKFLKFAVYRQPVFCDWGFNLERGEPIKEKWDLIPDDTDILITHGPPIGEGSSTCMTKCMHNKQD